MSWFGSKAPQTTAAATPTINLASAATVGLSSVQEAQKQFETALEKSRQAVEYQTGRSGLWWGLLKFSSIVILAILVIILSDWITIKLYGHGWIGFLDDPPVPPPSEKSILFIDKATYSNDVDSRDVTAYMQSIIENDTVTPSFILSYAAVGQPTALAASKTTPATPNTLNVSYHLCDDPVGTYTADGVSDGQAFPSLPAPTNTCKGAGGYRSGAPPATSGKPGLISRVMNYFSGDSSGDLAPSYHDASSAVTIQGNRAPLSSQNEGGYGMQWWMYVKDWNYGYGKKKSVVKRPDATNSSVMNPHIALHPTDNSLQISVSVFPATEGGASKSTPAPAGHSGSTDDVFVCEVPNIPLQTWFSVSVTVFGRNLDVYIDGKLVKSCFLTGVPKPAVGDIQLTPEGGFSGRICGFYHYPRMLTPSDAQTFYNTGTSCKGKTESGMSGKATGYSVKFGVYDSLGKEVQEYAF